MIGTAATTVHGPKIFRMPGNHGIIESSYEFILTEVTSGRM